MTITATRAQLVIGLATLALAMLGGPPAAWAAGVVGAGTAASCTETALTSALTGGGMVTFNCGGMATITLSSPETIAADTSIDGGGNITISGNGSVSAFYVNAGVTFAVRNLNITASGFIDIANFGGTVYATNCNFLTAGNGLVNFISGATATVTNCTFRGIVTAVINNAGGTSFTATGSTFQNNDTGIANNVPNTTADVSNCTFANNGDGSGSAAIFNVGTATVENCTIAGNNSPGIWNFGSATLTNTLLSGNLLFSVSANCSGSDAVVDGGHNLDDGATCGFTGISCATTSGTSLCNANPQLDPTGLKNNGGATETIALCTGPGRPTWCTGASPAIDAGEQVVCAATPVNDVDQRGLPRSFPSDPICDIGAFEVQRPGTPAPAVSVCGLISLVVLLSGVGWRMLRWPRGANQ